MNYAPTILIVHADARFAAGLAAKLTSAGDVATATTFTDAKTLLKDTPPALLITGAHLGEYNGLHLIIRSHLDSPATAGIVISDEPDPGLVAEAARFGALCVSYPEDESTLLLLVKEALTTIHA